MRRFASLFVFFAVPAVLLAQQSATPQTPQPTAANAAPAQPVQDAEALIAQSKWPDAENKLNVWLAAHPTDARALFDAGYAADAQNQLDNAAALYRRAVAADPSSLEAHLSLGLLLARQNKLDEARPELQKATTLDPGAAGPALKARAWRALAQIDRAHDPAQASTDLMEALKLTPETSDDTLLAAELAESTGDLNGAEKAYRRLLAQNPKSADANEGLAHILIAQKQYPEAETLLRTALTQSPDNPALTAQLATVLADENKGEALPLLEKLHTDHPQDAAITSMLAEVRAEAGDFAGSDQLYTALLAASPRDSSLLIAHGQNQIRMMHFAEAYQAFEQATQAAPTNADAWSGLAFAASKMNRPSVVIQALTERAKYVPDNASTYFLWAISYDALHDKKSAADYYHRFLQAAQGKFPNQEWQARQRLLVLDKR